jgi:hypothetical protein
MLYSTEFFLLCAAFVVLSRMAGGGLGADTARFYVVNRYGKHLGSMVGRLPEIALAILAASYTPYPLWGQVLSAIIIFFGWELGHGTFYQMGGYFSNEPGRIQTIERLIRAVYKGSIYTPLYSWLCMGAKGAIIGMPFGLTGAVTMALLLPMCYFIGHRLERIPEVAEYLAGIPLALVVATYA